MISVAIPTFNSAKTLGVCLTALFGQTYRDFEVIVADSHSSDATRDVASTFDVRFVETNWRLLGARYLANRESRGDLRLLLDSDQVLERTALARAVRLANHSPTSCDMLCLEEAPAETESFLGSLFEADRRLLHSTLSLQLNPVSGVLLPRLFRSRILDSAFAAIPTGLLPTVIAHDHAIIYFEAVKLSSSIGILKNAVTHLEPLTIREFLKKNFRYGENTRILDRDGHYRNITRGKMHLRRGAFTGSDFKAGLQSTLLNVLRGVPYLLGFAVG